VSGSSGKRSGKASGAFHWDFHSSAAERRRVVVETHTLSVSTPLHCALSRPQNWIGDAGRSTREQGRGTSFESFRMAKCDPSRALLAAQQLSLGSAATSLGRTVIVAGAGTIARKKSTKSTSRGQVNYSGTIVDRFCKCLGVLNFLVREQIGNQICSPIGLSC
jgi:hypothetical protein